MRSDPAGSRMAPAMRGGGASSSSSVVVDTDVDALVAEIVGRATDACDHEIGELMRSVLAEAIRVWPVDTGRSRSAFRLVDTGTADDPAWRLMNDAPYSRAIVQRDERPVLPAIRLVYAPIRDHLRTLGDKVRRGVGGGP